MLLEIQHFFKVPGSAIARAVMKYAMGPEALFTCNCKPPKCHMRGTRISWESIGGIGKPLLTLLELDLGLGQLTDMARDHVDGLAHCQDTSYHPSLCYNQIMFPLLILSSGQGHVLVFGVYFD